MCPLTTLHSLSLIYEPFSLNHLACIKTAQSSRKAQAQDCWRVTSATTNVSREAVSCFARCCVSNHRLWSERGYSSNFLHDNNQNILCLEFKPLSHCLKYVYLKRRSTCRGPWAAWWPNTFLFSHSSPAASQMRKMEVTYLSPAGPWLKEPATFSNPWTVSFCASSYGCRTAFCRQTRKSCCKSYGH